MGYYYDAIISVPVIQILSLLGRKIVFFKCLQNKIYYFKNSCKHLLDKTLYHSFRLIFPLHESICCLVTQVSPDQKRMTFKELIILRSIALLEDNFWIFLR